MNNNPAYELFDELGRGENTVVYRGYDLDLGRDVAIKELNEKSRQDARRAGQFLKEAGFLAQFEHEHILRIYSVDKERGWIVMELMKGTLASQIADAPMAPDTVRSVMRQILSALEFLHQKNKVHGAVRPSNILINELGTAKLSDFEATDSAGELRAPTGSKKHLAPELIRAEFGEFGTAVDLYCLGFTALELLTGPKFDSLFPGTGKGAIDADVAWLRWHSSDENLEPVKKLCPHVPDDLADVIDKMLAKDAASRPQSAAEVLGMISEQAFIPVMVKEAVTDKNDQVASSPLAATVKEVGETTHRKSPNAPSAKKSTSRRPQPTTTQAGKSTKDKVNEFLGKPFVLWPLCAFMLIGAVLVGLQLQKESSDLVADPLPPENGNVQIADKEETKQPIEAVIPPLEPTLANVRLAISPDATNAVVEINGEPAQPTAEGSLTLEPGTYQLQIRKPGFEDYTQALLVQRDNLDVAISLRALPDPIELEPVKVAVTMPAGARFQTGEEVIQFPDAVADRVDFEVSHQQDEVFTFSATGDGYEPITRSITWEKLAASKFRVNVTLDPIQEPKIEEPLVAGERESNIIDPLETLFVNAEEATKEQAEKTAKLAGQFTGKAELVIDSGGFLGELMDVSFSPDGKLLAAAGGKVVRIWNLETGDLVATLRGDRSRTSYGNVNAAKFSPDGKTLLVGISDYKKHGSIREYSTADFTEIQRLIPGHTAPCRKIAFSGTGRRISADADGNLLIADNTTDELLGTIEAADPNQPTFDLIAYPDATDDTILAIDAQGPKVFSPAGQLVSSQDQLPDKVMGWLIDVFTKKIKYPYGSTKDPRVLDFAFENKEWAAAGVSLVDGRNRFWAGIFPSRGAKETGTESKPKQVYAGHRWSITCIELGPNQQLAATGDKFGEVHVWNRNTGKLLHKFQAQGQSIYEVGFDENSNRIAYGTRPFKPDVWNRNNYGDATRVLDLRQRAILPRQATDNLKLVNERPNVGAMSVDVSKTQKDPSYFVNLKRSGSVVAKYKISSARNPTVFSLIDQPKLGVQVPVVFGDSEGLLALWDTASDELRRAFIGHGSLVSGVSFSRNGKLMVSASTDRTICIWSLENHIPTGTFDFKFENSSVIKVLPGSSSEKAGVRVGDEVVTLDGHTIADMYDMMLDREFDYRPGQVVPMVMKRKGQEYTYNMTMTDGYDFVDPILNFYVGDDEQWIVWSPAGYYDASPGADQLIGWHVNRGPAKSAKFYEVQQFREQLYRPDIIDLILDGHDVKDAVQLANAEGNRDLANHDLRTTEEIAELHPPEVTILSPQPDTTTTNTSVMFTARVVSPNGLPIREATLLHNGDAIRVFPSQEIGSETLSVKHQVMLAPGPNRLELVANNGKTSSATVGIDITLKSKQPLPTADVHVLAIGVSDHAIQSQDLSLLKSPANDAQSFAEIMSAHQGGKLYRDVHTLVLTNQEATRSKIRDGFQWLVDNVKPHDSAIVFFSGYAFVDTRDNFYLASHDVDTERPRATAVSWREFVDMLHQDLPACKRFVFLDARPTAGGLRPGMRNPLFDLAAPEMGTTFFASNTLQQTGIEQTGARNGAFMQAIVDTLRDRQSDLMPNPRDQLLNPVELAQSIRTRVQKASSGRQLPTFFASNRIQRRHNLLELDVNGN